MSSVAVAAAERDRQDAMAAAWRNYDAAMEAARCARQDATAAAGRALRDAVGAAWRDYAAALDALAGGGTS